MLNKEELLKRLVKFGNTDQPIGKIISSSLEIAELLSELMNSLEMESRDSVMDHIFSTMDLTYISIKELLDKIDEHLRNS